MSETETETETEIESTTAPLVVDTETGDHERYAHYIAHPERKRAASIVTEATVMGIPVTALCGKVWIPGRDPERFPVCPECREIRDRALGKA